MRVSHGVSEEMYDDVTSPATLGRMDSALLMQIVLHRIAREECRSLTVLRGSNPVSGLLLDLYDASRRVPGNVLGLFQIHSAISE